MFICACVEPIDQSFSDKNRKIIKNNFLKYRVFQKQ